MGRGEVWDDELEELDVDERWLRRAARRDAERQRLPKHGRASTDLPREMLWRRGVDVADHLARGRKDAARRRTER
ncbi:MAG TPA: hypothetical protein VKZ60_18800 [Chloroflexota bacterium]|jgi:hypothetical protein|nr:hypothetical protein [Chloroflexota bacterium]